MNVNNGENRMVKKILILAANPTKNLKLEQEIRDIEEGLKRSAYREEFVLEIKLAVRVKDLQATLLEVKPWIVHFCGHGTGSEGLVLENDTGKQQFVSTEALADLFRIVAKWKVVECVLLNACYSKEQAEEIVKHINYVIGMQQEIRDDAAIAFTVGFYEALGSQETIESAYEWGCNRIQLETNRSTETRKGTAVNIDQPIRVPEHLIPVLLKNPNLVVSIVTERKNFLIRFQHLVRDKIQTLRKYIQYVLFLSGIGTLGTVFFGLIAFYLSPKPSECFSPKIQPGSVRVLTSHLEGNKIRWWVAKDKQGLTTFTCQVGNCKDKTLLSDERTYLNSETVLAVAWDEGLEQPEEIWVSTSEGTLAKLKKQSNRNSWKQTNTFQQQYCPASTMVVQSNKLNLGAAHSTQPRLYSFDKKQKWSDSQSLDVPENINLRVTSMIVNEDTQTKWVGTKEGLYRVDSGKAGSSIYPPWVDTQDPFSFQVQALAIDSKKNIWVGTKKQGLLFFNSITADDWHLLTGIPSQEITAISLSESKQIALIGTNNGLSICKWKENHRKAKCSQINDEKFDNNRIEAVNMASNLTAAISVKGKELEIIDSQVLLD